MGRYRIRNDSWDENDDDNPNNNVDNNVATVPFSSSRSKRNETYPDEYHLILQQQPSWSTNNNNNNNKNNNNTWRNNMHQPSENCNVFVNNNNTNNNSNSSSNSNTNEEYNDFRRNGRTIQKTSSQPFAQQERTWSPSQDYNHQQHQYRDTNIATTTKTTGRISYFSSFVMMTLVAYIIHQYQYMIMDLISHYLYIPPGPPPPIHLYSKYSNQQHQHQYNQHHHHDNTNHDPPQNDQLDHQHESSASSSSSSSSPSSSSSFHSHSQHSPPNTSWNEYIHEHTHQLLHSFMALGIQTPYYILSNAMKSFITDLQFLYSDIYYHGRQKSYPWFITIQNYITTMMIQSSSFLHGYNNHTNITTTTTTLQSSHMCQWNVPSLLDTSQTNTNHNTSIVVIGQEMAVNYLQNAMYTWIQQQSTITTPETKTKRPLIVFATGYEHTGKRTLAQYIISHYRIGTNCDATSVSTSTSSVLYLHGYDWKLQNYEIDIEHPEHTARYRRRLYRKLIHVIESHYYNIQRHQQHSSFYDATTITATDSPPSMIVITNIEYMDSVILLQLLSSVLPKQLDTTTGNFVPNDEKYSSSIDHDDTNQGDFDPTTIQNNKLRQLCQNSIIYLTSNQYGVSAIVRHLRRHSGGVTSSSTTTTAMASSSTPSITLISDIRDIVQRELHDDITKIFNAVTILPFVPFTPKSLGELLRHRINTYYVRQVMASSILNLCPSTIVITDRAIQVLIDERNVEYIEWRTKSKRSNTDDGVPVTSTATTLQIVVEGANAIHDQNPVMTKLYTQLHQVMESLSKETSLHSGKVLLLDYDTSSTITLYDRGMFQLCDSTIINADNGAERSTSTTEHDPTMNVIVSSSSSTLTNHDCKLLRRFQL